MVLSLKPNYLRVIRTAAVVLLAASVIFTAETLTLAGLPHPAILFSGESCGDKSANESRLEELVKMEQGFGSYSATLKSADEISQLASESVYLTKLDIQSSSSRYGDNEITLSSSNLSTIFKGINVGDGYVYTVAHGVLDKKTLDLHFFKVLFYVHPYDADNFAIIYLGYPGINMTRSSFDPSSGKFVDYFYEAPLKGDALATASAPMSDVASVLPNSTAISNTPARFKLRPASTLKKDENIYFLANRNNSIDIILGFPNGHETKVVSGAVSDPIATSPVPGFFTSSLQAISGDSGSPVFDEYGNLVGLVSGGITRGSEQYSVIAGIESILPVIMAERQRISSCS